MLLLFVVAGVLGIPVGVALGRLGALREAATTGVLSALAATATCSAQNFDAEVQQSLGQLALISILVMFIFMIVALPLPALGYVTGWALKWRRESGARP